MLIDTPHKELVIEARSRVEVHPSRDTLPFSMAWEAVRARSLAGASLGADAPASFLYPTPAHPDHAGDHRLRPGKLHAGPARSSRRRPT